jgi:hypothetical protein
MIRLLIPILINVILSDSLIPIGSKNKTIKIKDNCQETRINTNYKHININIYNVHNIEKLIITDKPLKDCNINQCHSNSTICQSDINII